MASMTSVISLFVLLLVTYSYSKPVFEQYSSSTPEYQFTTDETTVYNGSSSYMESVPYEVATGTSTIHHQRSFTDLSDEETTTSDDVTVSARSVPESESEETTTSDDVTVSSRFVPESESEENTTSGDVTVSARSVEGLNSEESTTPDDDVTVSSRLFDISSSTPSEEEQNYTEFTSTTIESNTAFNQRAIPHSVDYEDLTSSTPYYGQFQQGIHRNIQSSSSVTKFGQHNALSSNEQPSQFQQQGPTNVRSVPKFLPESSTLLPSVATRQVEDGQVSKRAESKLEGQSKVLSRQIDTVGDVETRGVGTPPMKISPEQPF